jgi:hypothetical protein
MWEDETSGGGGGGFVGENMKERSYLRDLGIDGRIVLKCILNK